MAAFDPATARELEMLLKSYTKDPYSCLPRVVVAAASSRDGLVYSGRSGWAQVPSSPTAADGEPIAEDSIFELFSCTKLVATIAVMQLVEQGLLGLDDEAERWVAELGEAQVCTGFADDGKTPVFEGARRRVTVRMLLTHTAGLDRSAGDQRLRDYYGLQYGPSEVKGTKESLTKLPLKYQPGTRWAYSTGLDFLTLVVEAISGLNIEEYYQRHIFAPLGITDISYVPSSRKISVAHDPPPYTFDSTIPPRARFDSGGTGLFGSALSYLRILRAILGGGQLDGARILRPDTVDLMFQGHLSDDDLDRSTQLDDLEQFGTFADPFWFGSERQLPGAVDWGLGGMLTGLVEGCYSHGREAGTMTWTGKANTFWVIDRRKDLAYVCFTNMLPNLAAPAFKCWKEVEVLLYTGIGRA